MKSLFFSIAFLVSAIASADPGYTLNQICRSLSANPHVCVSVGFCQEAYSPEIRPGCHAKPDSAYAEQLCVGFSAELCNPQTTACFMTNVYRPAQSVCVASRPML